MYILYNIYTYIYIYICMYIYTFWFTDVRNFNRVLYSWSEYKLFEEMTLVYN